jgi:hypothetical protein
VQNKQQGFSSQNNELPTHRLSADFDWHTLSGWSFSFHSALLLYDHEEGWTVGLYLQKGF